ncbi:MAG: hypothetical protein V1936_02260 [Patescibacteria group bacterium]
MKKFLLALLIALTPLALFGCGSSTDPATEDTVAYEKLTGVIQKLGASIYQQGTHRLEKDGALVALLESAGPQIDLNDYLGQSVEVEGILSPTVEGNLQIMKVVTVTPEGGVKNDSTEEYQNYSDEQFGFSVKYPTVLKAQQTRRGASFSDGDKKVVEVVILDNTTKQDLIDWLVDNYGYTVDALRRVSVAGLTGYQFQNTTGSVIYLANADKVFTLAWYDNSEANRARNRRYYLEIVQSFAVVGIVQNGGPVEATTDSSGAAAVGDFCGGIAAIPCAAGLDCRLSGNYPDAGGICVYSSGSSAAAVTSDQVAANSKLAQISAAELQRGWYYGDRETKKPGTPDTWILVDSGSRSAMWRRLDSAPVETPVILPDATMTPNQLSTEQKQVLDYLTKNINFLSPEAAKSGDWNLAQLAFADPNFVYAIFTAGSAATEIQTRRLLLTYAVSAGEVTTEMQAFFKPGTDKDWLVVEGADMAFGKGQKVVNASGEITSNILDGYRLFSDYGSGFQFQYPKDWYWRKASSTKFEFSDKPFPAGLILLTVEFVTGKDFDFGATLTEDNKKVVYLTFDAKKSIRMSASKDALEVLLTASKTFALK